MIKKQWKCTGNNSQEHKSLLHRVNKIAIIQWCCSIRAAVAFAAALKLMLCNASVSWKARQFENIELMVDEKREY